MSRYARQMVLPEVGAAGQNQLACAHVLVVGAGGLGAPVLQNLSGAGIVRITPLDRDTKEGSLFQNSVSVLGQRGCIGGLCGTAPSLRALLPELWGSAANCVSVDVMGLMVGAIGALQTQGFGKLKILALGGQA